MLNNDLNCSAGPEGKYPLIKVPNPLGGQDGTGPPMQVYRPMYPGDFEALNAALPNPRKNIEEWFMEIEGLRTSMTLTPIEICRICLCAFGGQFQRVQGPLTDKHPNDEPVVQETNEFRQQWADFLTHWRQIFTSRQDWGDINDCKMKSNESRDDWLHRFNQSFTHNSGLAPGNPARLQLYKNAITLFRISWALKIFFSWF